MPAAGSAIISDKGLSPFLGWVGLVAGATTVVNVLAAKTPLDALAAAAFMPALLLTLVFRVWAGCELWKCDPAVERAIAATARSISAPTVLHS
jgi:hypothetical protein